MALFRYFLGPSSIPLEKEMATHSSVLAWRIPETGEPSGLPSMGSHRVGHDWSDLAAAAAVFRCMNVPHLLYPLICWWILRFLPCFGYCEQCCCDLRGVCIFWVIILSRYMLRSGIVGSYGNSFSFLKSLHAVFHSGGASVLNLSSILYFHFCWMQTSRVTTLWWAYSDKVLFV